MNESVPSHIADAYFPTSKPVPDMAPEEVAWLAGLLEGEGCFTLSREGRSPRITLAMTDHDVVRRAARISGVGRLNRKPRKPPRKDQLSWSVGRIDDVRHILHLILPYMGERRTQRIRELLDAITGRYSYSRRTTY